MMKFIRSFLFVAVGLMFSFEGRGSGDRFTEEFNSHLGTLRAYVARTGIDSLCFGGSETSSSESVSSVTETIGRGPSTEEVMAFWGIQRGIERLLEERPLFETFKNMMSSLRSFGEEVKDEGFWKEAVSVYSETDIPSALQSYDGENHWQTWFKAHLCPSFGTMEDVLGCVLYPVRFTTIHLIEEWKSDPSVFYLQAHSASYGNRYARVRVTSYLEAYDPEMLETSSSIASRSPFDKSFDIDSDINKLLWAAFANVPEKYKCAYVPQETRGLIWPQEAAVLQKITHQTGESLCYLGRCFLHMNKQEEAMQVWKKSAALGFKESGHILGEGLKERPRLESLDDEDRIVYAAYKEVFGAEPK